MSPLFDELKLEIMGKEKTSITPQDQNKTNMKRAMLQAKEDQQREQQVNSLGCKHDQENVMPLYLDLLVRNETQCEGLNGQMYGQDDDLVTSQVQNIYEYITESQMGSDVTKIADVQNYTKHKVCGEDGILTTSQDMYTCVIDSQMEPGVATDIPIHGRRHTFNQIAAISENAQVVKTTNQSNHRFCKRHLTLIALLSVTVCVTIATGITGVLVKYKKRAGKS